MIPKIVYTFWDGEMDVYERACLQNLRDTNPDFDVVLLSSDNVENKPINYDELSRQAKSDWARVEAVERTGGVWIDMACIMLKPIEAWVDFDSDMFHGFEVPFACPVIESWAFAAPMDCPIVRQWKSELKRAVERGFETYNRENDIPSCLKDRLPYLTVHQALHVAWHKIPDKKHTIRRSTDEGMPYHIISKHNWNYVHFVDELTRESHLDDIFIKVNGNMRKAIKIAGVREMNAHEKSHKDRYSHVERVLNIRIGRDWNTWIILFVVLILLIIATLNRKRIHKMFNGK